MCSNEHCKSAKTRNKTIWFSDNKTTNFLTVTFMATIEAGKEGNRVQGKEEQTNMYIASTSLLVGLPRGGFQLEFRRFEIGPRWNCDLPQLRLAQSARCDSGDVLAVMTTTGECHASHHHLLPVDGTWSKDF